MDARVLTTLMTVLLIAACTEGGIAGGGTGDVVMTRDAAIGAP